MKEVDDVLGGAAAWENVDSCDEKVNFLYVCKTIVLSCIGNLIHPDLTYISSLVSKVREPSSLFHANSDQVGNFPMICLGSSKSNCPGLLMSL